MHRIRTSFPTPLSQALANAVRPCPALAGYPLRR